jgi:F-type H+-transporting ATPase subunit b
LIRKKTTSNKMSSGRKNVRWWFLALLLLSFAGVIGSLRAQERPSPQQPQTPTGNSGRKHEGVGRQLARETREAAGEEKDDTAEFKQSAAVQLVSRLTGMSLQHAYWLSKLLNFVAIAAVIFWAGRKYLPGMFRERTSAIQKAMQEAQKASEEARRKLAEIESRLMKLDVEIGMMRDAAEKEGLAEELRLQAAAQEDARKIVQSAEQEIAAAIKAARRALTAYAADLAVGMAKKQIHVDATTDQTLVGIFAGQLGAAPQEPGDAARENTGKDGR